MIRILFVGLIKFVIRWGLVLILLAAAIASIVEIIYNNFHKILIF